MSSRKIDAARHSADLLAQAHEWANQTEADFNPEETPTEWTPQLINRAASVAISRRKWSPGALRESNSIDLATSAVGLTIAENPEATFWDAVNQAQYELLDVRNQGLRDQGYTPQTLEPAPRYWAYWMDPEDIHRYKQPTSCIENMTVEAVFAALPQRHKRTLLQVAFSETLEEAADMAGMSNLHSFRERVRAARKAALELWFDDETPAKPRRQHTYRPREKYCPQGHLVAGENAMRETVGGRSIYRCRQCRLEQNRAWKAKQK